MGDNRITSPRLTVIRDGLDPVELQTTNADLVLWDKTRHKHRWPKPDEGPFIWLTFISWAAARRTGVIGAETKYETWESEVLDVSTVEDDDDAGTPTNPGPVPG